MVHQPRSHVSAVAGVWGRGGDVMGNLPLCGELVAG